MSHHNMALVNIVQRTSTYGFFEPDYTTLIDDAIDFLKYLKENPSSETEANHRSMKNMFWDVVMRIAYINQFQSKTKIN